MYKLSRAPIGNLTVTWMVTSVIRHLGKCTYGLTGSSDAPLESYSGTHEAEQVLYIAILHESFGWVKISAATWFITPTSKTLGE